MSTRAMLTVMFLFTLLAMAAGILYGIIRGNGEVVFGTVIAGGAAASFTIAAMYEIE